MKKQMTKITMMLVLVIGLAASAAFAQNKGSGSIAPVGIYTGMETSPGKCDAISAICSGNTFVMTSYGEWETHTLVLFVEYSMNTFVPNSYVVTGGSWSLVVVSDKGHAGTLSGEILSGEILLVQDKADEPSSKNVQLSLVSVSGVGIFDGKAGENISGVYNAATDLKTKNMETNGTAIFGF